MNKQEARDLIMAHLAPLLPGFEPRKKDQSFVRKIAGGAQMIVIPLVDYKPDFLFSLMVTMRVEEVEAIINQFSGSPPAYHAQTLTTMTPLEYFFSEFKEKQIKVISEDDIKRAVHELASVIQGKILPLVDRVKDVKALDAIVNSPEGASFDNSNQPYRAMHAVILARLAGNPQFDEIVARYQQETKSWQPIDQKKFSDLVSFLRSP